jgi:hypothetical protein
MQTNDVATREEAPAHEGAFSASDPIVDDATYDLLQALTSKLEAIEAYEQYVLDGNESIFSDLLEDERRHARRLVGALRERLASA